MIADMNKSKEIFSLNLMDRFINSITGASETRIIQKNPEDKFFVGKLYTQVSGDDNPLSSETCINKIGLEFVIDENSLHNAELKIFPYGDFYFRVLPKLEEQQESFVKMVQQSEAKIECFNDLIKINNEEGQKLEEPIVPVFEKYELNKDDFYFTIKLSDIYDAKNDYGYIDDNHNINITFREYIDDIEQLIMQREDCYRDINARVRIKDLIDENCWHEFIKKNSKSIVGINWNLSISVSIKPMPNGKYRISVDLLNQSPDMGLRDSLLRINTFFNSMLKVRIDYGEFLPITMDYFEDDYKYNCEQMAIGMNCSIIEGDDPFELVTTHLPIFKQYRLKTNNSIPANFVDLIKDPIGTLEVIYQKMLEEKDNWEKDYQTRDGLTSKGKAQFRNEIDSFYEEINRFKNGIELIKNYSIIRKAFIMMNQTFKSSSKKYDGWRLFQIVFIVSLILDIASTEKGLLDISELKKSRLENVDLLYFPTGGGKTEAFLGVVVFNLFFDRLRGKKIGVTAIIKYPLRLLSIQQVQRIADILAIAEEIRCIDEDTSDGEIYSIGYLVGETSTPNSIGPKEQEKISEMSQEERNQEYQILDSCPYCGSSTINVVLTDTNQLKHKCMNQQCNSGEFLPIYIVDNEIYQNIPSIIVSTIDKQAALGYQSNYANLLGQILFKCPEHGYNSKQKCIHSKCAVDPSKYEKVELYDPAPTLLIQDELHLVRESLGVYDAHYEGLLQYFVKELSPSKRPMKIIGATATISSYQQQIYHLYLKEPIRFPSESPYIQRNFYSYIDFKETNRIILGYAPFGKAIINSVVYSMQYLKIILFDYFKHPNKILEIKNIGITTIEEAIKILEDYWIVLQYNNVKLDGNRVVNALDDPINTELNEMGVQQFVARKMTGDDTFQDVRKILSEIENTKNVFDGLNLITATSMISHGVDADKFNQMFFFGMPGNTAEYIQAYSRAGRKNCGLIFMIMRPTREKDKSYLRNFIKFHEFKDILVEPVPINRWASKAIEKTIPGILAGIIINYYNLDCQFKVESKNLYQMKGIQEAINKALLNMDEIKTHMYRIYGCEDNDGIQKEIGNQYRDAISKFVDNFFDKIVCENYRTRESNYYITEGIEKLGFNRPMFSLRDTDKNVTMELV